MDLLIELALERDNDSHMEKFLKRHLGKAASATPERGEGKGPKTPPNANKGGGKGGGNLRAMKEVTPEGGAPPLFYCKPVDYKGGPCHAQVTQSRYASLLATKWLIERLGNRQASRAAGAAKGDAQSLCQRQNRKKEGLAYTAR